jgi:hypothetical protein
MTIELRQLVVKSTVEDEDKRSFNTAGGCPQEMAQIKEEIMAECRTWVLAQLQQLRER